GRRAHEILPESGPKPSGPDPLVTGALRTQVNEAKRLKIATLGDPAEHTSAMTVDAVPHDLAHESADLLEADDLVELGHAHRHLVAADLGHQRPALRVHEPWLARGGADARIALHALHQQLEVPDREFQVHVQLAKVVEVLQTHRLETGVEGLDNAWP